MSPPDPDGDDWEEADTVISSPPPPGDHAPGDATSEDDTWDSPVDLANGGDTIESDQEFDPPTLVDTPADKR